MHDAQATPETFALAWLRTPGHSSVIGSVTLPNRPSTLGEARGGLEMMGGDEATARWLQRWVETGGDERNLLLQLPDSWFEVSAATLTLVPGGGERYLLRFDRRSASDGPAA